MTTMLDGALACSLNLKVITAASDRTPLVNGFTSKLSITAGVKTELKNSLLKSESVLGPNLITLSVCILLYYSTKSLAKSYILR